MQMSESYPKWKYHPSFSPALVQSGEDEKALEGKWYDSPADFGVETAPGVRPDKEVAKNKKKAESKPEKEK